MEHKIRWTSQKIAERLKLIESLVYRTRQALPAFRYLPLSGPEEDPPVESNVDDSGWDSVAPFSYWGQMRSDFVLRTTFVVPGDWLGDAPAALYLPLGVSGDFSHPEALAYIDGAPYAGCDRHHQEVPLPDSCRDGRTHLLALHGWSGLDGWSEDNPETRLFMRPCAVVLIDQPTRDFISTARIALGIADQLDDSAPAKELLYNALNNAFRMLDTREPIGDGFYASVPAAHAELKAGVEKAGPPLEIDIVASGHAHIDLAWLWTVHQARRKAGRTFHTVLRLMEQFPDFCFTQSQPQLYDYVRQDYPDLFEAIKARVREGRWEPVGGMWVEADCNLSGAEALARQFLLGRTLFREQFGPGAEAPVLWLPDVFGYTWNLPQLIKEAGLDYFFTIKISWNQYNRIPYDTFWWQGLDGTKVLTHFSTTRDGGTLPGVDTQPSTYNAKATAQEVMATWRNLQQKETQKEMLMAFGYGDGGGGPTREMLENIREMNSFAATPRVRNGRARDFFHRLEASAADRLPTWNGELYLEYHRGTYTTQARNKRSNRKCEFLLHDAEFLAAWAAAAAADYAYPHAALARAWKLLCLNQFHDILPGSSISEVYEQSAKDYALIRGIAEQIRDTALEALVRRLSTETAVVAVNPTSFRGRQIGLLPERLDQGQALIELARGELVTTQPVQNGTLLEVPHLEAYGLAALGFTEERQADARNTVSAQHAGSEFILENELLRVVFDASGDMVSLFDKQAGRDVLSDGERANVFQAFEDRPLYWDAWDIDIFYDDKQWPADPAHSLNIIEEGPLRAGLEIKRRLLNSEIVQRIYLYRDGRRLDFDTQIDWRERHILLKVAFPVDVLSPAATFDVQWGNVQRPTHRNTSWDWARFETCAHKWVDLSEGNYGVSLLNDCKYGHDIRDNVIRLTLLRSPTFPAADADQGDHRFIYSLLPHPGDWREETSRAAYALNDPLIVRRVQGSGGDMLNSLVAVDAENVIIETVKQAEDGLGLIVRLFENERCRSKVVLTTSLPLAAAYRCNLLEENQTLLEITDNAVILALKPYEIATVRLEL